ncbi:MAG: uridine kinase [Candidatus Marinimicrobia bacterium]|jgi:uridine kinase|nr:uridine kinase [Candidatus Neomarinimicrobiota bacterium]MDP7465301.1 uridine kinase [Candidatus Neomarinimicrobiota bacterium]
MNKYAILIGIAGGTGSGKTSIAKAIASDFGKSEVALIEQDSYYKNLSNLTIEERSLVNFDHPDAIDFTLMRDHLQKLMEGNVVDIPIYDYTTHTREKKSRKVEKHHIIILEGILALFDQKIRNMMDIKIYVETADDIRVIRRIKRDINKRERTFPSVIEQYYKTVRPMHIQFVEPTKKYADIIVPEGGQNKVAVDILRTKIMTLLINSKNTN